MSITVNTIVWLPSSDISDSGSGGRLTTLEREHILSELRDRLVELGEISKDAARIKNELKDVVDRIPEQDAQQILRDVFKNQGAEIVSDPVRLYWKVDDTETGNLYTVSIETTDGLLDPEEPDAWVSPCCGRFAGVYKSIVSDPTGSDPVYSDENGEHYEVTDEVCESLENELLKEVGLDRKYVWSFERVQ
jgi:hypothetical protein